MADETFVQPKLGDLFARIMKNQKAAQDAGIAGFDAAEVQPFEAGPVQPVDAKLAWDEAQVALAFFAKDQRRQSIGGRGARGWQAPPHWASLVAGHEPELALPFAVANFPQLVRNFHLILESVKPGEWEATGGRAPSAPGLAEWAQEVATQQQFPEALLAVGALRLAKQWDAAAKLVHSLDTAVPGDLRTAWDNERAALLWQCGRIKEARDLWHQIEPAVPVLFNRGMADLFLGNGSAARTSLNAAVKHIPESSGWHHLGKLYLTLAEGR